VGKATSKSWQTCLHRWDHVVHAFTTRSCTIQSRQTAHASACLWLQGTREVEGLVFTMVSDLGKLKRKVDLLGGPKDTLSHR
jgi:hypothetical protein